MEYKNIMVAIDESESSKLALKEAIRLAKKLDAKLQVLHIVDETIFNQVDEYVEFDWLWNAHRELGQKILDEAQDKLKSAKVAYTMRLSELKPNEGRLAEKIVSEAKALPADILVIGTHGRKGFSRLFLGSVAENVIRIATLPVLLVRDLKS